MRRKSFHGEIIACAGMAVLLLMASRTAAQEPSREQVEETFRCAREMAGSLTLPETNPKTAASARKDYRIVQSPKVRERLEAAKRDILEKQFGPVLPEISPKASSVTETSDRLGESESILIFVSSSMPLAVLRSYVRDLDRLRDPSIMLVLRGFLDGMRYFQPTRAFMEKLLVKDSACRLGGPEPCDAYQADIQIDPLLFRKFNVTQVPAVTYVRDVRLLDTGQSLGKAGNLQAEPDAVILYGDASLEFALEKIYAAAKSPRLQTVIHHLKGDYYE